LAGQRRTESPPPYLPLRAWSPKTPSPPERPSYSVPAPSGSPVHGLDQSNLAPCSSLRLNGEGLSMVRACGSHGSRCFAQRRSVGFLFSTLPRPQHVIIVLPEECVGLLEPPGARC